MWVIITGDRWWVVMECVTDGGFSGQLITPVTTHSLASGVTEVEGGADMLRESGNSKATETCPFGGRGQGRYLLPRGFRLHTLYFGDNARGSCCCERTPATVVDAELRDGLRLENAREGCAQQPWPAVFSYLAIFQSRCKLRGFYFNLY